MEQEKRVLALAANRGADYAGIADLTSAHDEILRQGRLDTRIYPRAISVGIGMIHDIVDRLMNEPGRATAVSYKSHCYDVINHRLDEIGSRIAGYLQQEGYRAFPIPASRRIDDERICGIFSHKLAAHLAGLGWIGRSCLLVTPDMGPRVRWTTVLTDAPLTPAGDVMEPRCGECRRCVDACPAHCFTGAPFRPDEPRSVRYDASACDRHFRNMKALNPETAVCGLCVAVCPHGRR